MSKSERKHTPVSELEFFTRLEALIDEIWILVVDWDWFAKRTVGTQLVSSSDSIGANLEEGDGRFGELDAIRFFRYARSSAKEPQYWLRRAFRRKLIIESNFNRWTIELIELSRIISKLIAYRKQYSTSSSVHEETAQYGIAAINGHLREEHSCGARTSADFGSDLSDLRPQISDLRLRTSELRPRTPDLRPQTSDLEFTEDIP